MIQRVWSSRFCRVSALKIFSNVSFSCLYFMFYLVLFMKRFLSFLSALALICFLFTNCHFSSSKPRVLVFTKTAGFVHDCIPVAAEAVMKLGRENNFDVDTTSNAAWFTDDSLKKYAAVVFLSNTDPDDSLFTIAQKTDFQRYIEAGGNFVGVHAATDAGYHWGWYHRLVGATFNNHPAQQQATIDVVDADDQSTKHLPHKWSRWDEWYNFNNMDSGLHVLLKIDESTYTGGNMHGNHPMAWYHEYDGGRSWYTELGHTKESYSDPAYLMHLLGGIKYAIGDNENLNYAKVKTQRTPDEDRFTKTQLVQGTFFEPTEITVLPNLDVLVAQRRGEIMLYKDADHSVKQVGFLNVYWKTLHTPGVNAEQGLLGIQKDPDYKSNHYVYIYYCPADTSVNRLSRFTFNNDTIDNSTEKVILQFADTREICCHTGGSIAFGKDRTLFVSTGDNSTPFDEPNQKFVSHGFAPLNDAPGHLQYDSRRTAGNTNDLRGKILRIVMKEDGTYSIPKGNLFAEGTDKTKPEIYVMGDRNPYRISVDQKNGFLYWGEVGPDSNVDSFDTRGPKGYDEMNQARKAGFFGWPLFVANNQPYLSYNYLTGEVGKPFDAAHPKNLSQNNTGLTNLPPAQPAFIWYPYGTSKEFPQVGSGGRTAMTGPVYYTDMFPEKTRYPDYYNGKLFVYEWIRGWIKVVTMQENGDFDNMEPFMQGTKFNNPSDMEVGPDGRLYVVEYGSGWFAKNPDAGLARIDFNNGNRPPKVTGIQVNKTSGSLPLSIEASVGARDPDNDKLTYIWHVGSKTVETKEPKLQTTLSTAGDYAIYAEVKDDKNAVGKSDMVSVYAGNSSPDVAINIKGNKTFYFPGVPVQYSIAVNDKEEGTAINDSGLLVTADYREGNDKAGVVAGHQVVSEMMMGKNLMESLDCKACHKVAEKSVGPAFTAVSEKYQKDGAATVYLANKIIKGGGGVWGDAVMSAHPNLSEADAKQIVTWVLSLANQQHQKSLPATGSLSPTAGKPVLTNGILYLSASYTDKGSQNSKPLTGNAFATLRNSNVIPGTTTHFSGAQIITYQNMPVVALTANDSWFALDSIDLSGITKATMNLGWQDVLTGNNAIEWHLDSPDGKLLVNYNIESSKPDSKAPVTNKTATLNLPPVTDGKLHTLYIVKKATGETKGQTVAVTGIHFSLK